MADKLPFTIEILEFGDERPLVPDRVIGGSVYFEEAKRIGQHCFPSLMPEHDLTGIASSATIVNRFILGTPEITTKPRPRTDANKDPTPRRDGYGVAGGCPQTSSGASTSRLP